MKGIRIYLFQSISSGIAVNDEKAVRAIEKRLTETDQSRAKALEKERKKLNKRLAELDRLFSSCLLYTSQRVATVVLYGVGNGLYQRKRQQSPF